MGTEKFGTKKKSKNASIKRGGMGQVDNPPNSKSFTVSSRHSHQPLITSRHTKAGREVGFKILGNQKPAPLKKLMGKTN